MTTTRTIYAWAKDAAGNVSTGYPTTVNIEIPIVTTADKTSGSYLTPTSSATINNNITFNTPTSTYYGLKCIGDGTSNIMYAVSASTSTFSKYSLDDGRTWATLNAIVYPVDMVYNGRKYIAISVTETSNSVDGISFTLVNPTGLTTATKICANTQTHKIVADSGTSIKYSSDDGVTWTNAITMTAYNTPVHLVSNNSLTSPVFAWAMSDSFYGSSLRTSLDGVNWSRTFAPVAGRGGVQAMAGTTNLICALWQVWTVPTYYFTWTNDGITWNTPVQDSFFNNTTGIFVFYSYGDKLFIRKYVSATKVITLYEITESEILAIPAGEKLSDYMRLIWSYTFIAAPARHFAVYNPAVESFMLLDSPTLVAKGFNVNLYTDYIADTTKYTTDGSDPVTNGETYSSVSPILINQAPTTLKYYSTLSTYTEPVKELSFT